MVWQYSLRYYWYCYNKKQDVLKKDVLKNFAKFTRKHPKKRFWLRCFHVNSAKILITSFFKEPFGWLLRHKHSFYLLSHHELSHFQKRCHTYFLAEYFLGLICRLETRVSSIFQALSQKPILNPVEHHQIDAPFFVEIVKSLKLLSIYAKKVPLWCSSRSKYASVSSH